LQGFQSPTALVSSILNRLSDIISQDGNEYAWAHAGMDFSVQTQPGTHYGIQFIADIRGARVRELEEKRINKEMANIRKKFKGVHVTLILNET
jgi:hypothetical protein